MLTVLGGLAEFERTLMKARTGEGRERARGRGVRFGRPLKLCAHQRREAIERLDAGDAVVDVARTSFHPKALIWSRRESLTYRMVWSGEKARPSGERKSSASSLLVRTIESSCGSRRS
jgi:DNA invertase Pin-like site-specific DNA recombinase